VLSKAGACGSNPIFGADADAHIDHRIDAMGLDG